MACQNGWYGCVCVWEAEQGWGHRCLCLCAHDAAYRWVSSHPMEKNVFVLFTSRLDLALNTGRFSKSRVLPWLDRCLEDSSSTVLSSYYTKCFTSSFMWPFCSLGCQFLEVLLSLVHTGLWVLQPRIHMGILGNSLNKELCALHNLEDTETVLCDSFMM